VRALGAGAGASAYGADGAAADSGVPALSAVSVSARGSCVVAVCAAVRAPAKEARQERGSRLHR